MAIFSQPDLHLDCLDKLSRALDLVLKTAEAASAANDHKLVIQSAREVTRLASLIHKMTGSKTKAGPSPRARPGRRQDCPRPGPRQSGKQPPGLNRRLRIILPPSKPAKPAKPTLIWMISSSRTSRRSSVLETRLIWITCLTMPLKNCRENCRELQALEKEVAAFLQGFEPGKRRPH